MTVKNNDNPSFVDVRNTKGKSDYRRTIQEIIDAGVCPFCPEHFSWHKNPTLQNEGDWLVTASTWPYENAKLHFLIICKSHKENFSELSIQDFGSLMKLVSWASDSYGIEGGGLILRFGSTKYTGATVAHLHFHLIVPEIDGDGNAMPVWFPIG